MTEVREFVARAERYAKRRGFELSTVSRKIFNDWERLADLKANKSRMFPETLKAATKKLEKLESELERAS